MDDRNIASGRTTLSRGEGRALPSFRALAAVAARLGTPPHDGDAPLGAMVVKASADAHRLGAHELHLLESASSLVGPTIARPRADVPQRESEVRFRALAANVPCAVVVLQGAQIRLANAAASDITGYALADLEGRALWDLVHPDDRNRVKRVAAEMRRSSAPRRCELRLVRKDGQPRSVDMTACVLEYSGGAVIMGVGRDITETDAGMHGAIDVIGAPALLQLCHQCQLTGGLEARHAGRTIRMTFEGGRLATASSDDAQGRDAVIDFLAWKQGRFAFRPGATAAAGPISEPTDFLILEGCRILDEKARRVEV